MPDTTLHAFNIDRYPLPNTAAPPAFCNVQFDLYRLEWAPASSDSEYVGCFADSKSDRIMDHMMIDEKMTAEHCRENCMRKGTNFYGTQVGYRYRTQGVVVRLYAASRDSCVCFMILFRQLVALWLIFSTTIAILHKDFERRPESCIYMRKVKLHNLIKASFGFGFKPLSFLALPFFSSNRGYDVLAMRTTGQIQEKKKKKTRVFPHLSVFLLQPRPGHKKKIRLKDSSLPSVFSHASMYVFVHFSSASLSVRQRVLVRDLGKEVGLREAR